MSLFLLRLVHLNYVGFLSVKRPVPFYQKQEWIILQNKVV
ncbi:hypothetical protein B4096_0871 [Heyndrickxia coagulans]|nr:hypothetical protein B4096_0871 [Heyndrickxia coagulans]